jgi:Uma2 family endonuclease
VRPAPSELDGETIPVPRTVRFPVELIPPDGFRPSSLDTWPRVEGRVEWVEGRLLYMPPCGGLQAFTVGHLVTALGIWARAHPDFVVATNEVGIRLCDDVRAADAAVWLRADVDAEHAGLLNVPPLLAAEVSSRDEPEAHLVEKARWYRDAGVAVVWCLFPEEREVLVIAAADTTRHRVGSRLPAHPLLPGLAPLVGELFGTPA